MSKRAKPKPIKKAPRRKKVPSLSKKSAAGKFQLRHDPSFRLAPVAHGFRTTFALAGGRRALSLARAAVAPGARVAATIPPGSSRQEVAHPGAFPWCSHVELILMLPAGGRAVGTGWVIGPRTVITAGHCVYDGGWMLNISVTPGGTDSGFETVVAANFDAPDEWVNGIGQERQKSDIGVVYVRDPFPAPITPLNYAVYDDATMGAIAPGRLSAAGFPANPFGSFLVDRGDLTDFNAPFLHYNVETSRGQSGAPLVHWEDDHTPVVIGVHHFNVAPNVNRAVRIGPNAAALLRSWTL